MTQIDIKKYPNLRLGKKSSENNELLTELIEKYNTHDTGKAELISGSGAPASLLPENTIYKDTATGDLYVGNGTKNIRHISSEYHDPDITVVSGTIPAIPADSRQVVQVTLGELKNPRQALIGFFLSTTADADIQAKKINASGTSFEGELKISGEGGNPNQLIRAPFIFPITRHYTDVCTNQLFVTEDYRDASRFFSIGSNELYGASLSFPNALPIYENLGVGVLVGYYSIAGTGFILLDKKIELESAWLTQSGNDTILNLALYNRDTAANTSKDFKVAVYE